MLFQIESRLKVNTVQPDATRVAEKREVRIPPEEKTLKEAMDFLRKNGFSENRLQAWFGDARLGLLGFPKPEPIPEGGFVRPKKEEVKKTSKAENRARLLRQYDSMSEKVYLKYKEDNHFFELAVMGKFAKLIGLYEEDFEKAEKKYNAPKELIAAILGIETKFGLAEADYPVFNLFMTKIQNQPRKKAKILEELADFLRLCKDYNVDPYSVKGSSEGAIFPGQYLPSTLYRKLERPESKSWEELSSFKTSIYLTAQYLMKKGATNMEGFEEAGKNFWAVYDYNGDPRYVRFVLELAQKY